MSQLVENISDTARWVATFRAEESERPDAVFHDPFARRLAGEKGEQIANAIKFGRDNSWSFVTRTYHFDEFIMQHVEQGYDMIINLAAGLDARAYRMQLPKTLKWIDVDLPDMINYKNEVLKNERLKCEYRTIALDLADRKARLALFQKLHTECKRALVVTEGLIIYLTDEQAAELAIDLSSQDHFHRWIFDLTSPALLEMIKKEMQPALKGSGAVFQFAPEEGEAFFEKYGWRWIETRSKLKTAAKLNRLTGETKTYAEMPEPPGPYRPFPWSGDCVLENVEAVN
ncbi:MAG TPA: SAM-dependent methyltransferase [Chitinophagaceae bacterium]